MLHFLITSLHRPTEGLATCDTTLPDFTELCELSACFTSTAIGWAFTSAEEMLRTALEVCADRVVYIYIYI
jgi:hypothetical protein